MPEAVTGTLSWIKKVCCLPPLILLSEGTGFCVDLWAQSVLMTISKGRWMKPWEIYPVSLELQTTLLCMDMMTAIMITISVLSCNVPVRLAFFLT